MTFLHIGQDRGCSLVRWDWVLGQLRPKPSWTGQAITQAKVWNLGTPNPNSKPSLALPWADIIIDLSLSLCAIYSIKVNHVYKCDNSNNSSLAYPLKLTREACRDEWMTVMLMGVAWVSVGMWVFTRANSSLRSRTIEDLTLIVVHIGAYIWEHLELVQKSTKLRI